MDGGGAGASGLAAGGSGCPHAETPSAETTTDTEHERHHDLDDRSTMRTPREEI